MTRTTVVRNGMAALCLLFIAQTSWSSMPTNPVSDRDFTILPNGKDLRTISVSGERLSLSRGTGQTFGPSAKAAYQKLKADSKADPNHKVHWVLMDLDGGRVLDQSANADKRLFGASSSKIFVGAGLLDKQAGAISSSQLQLMSDMLVVSSNTAWTNLQSQVGDGNSDKGRERIYAFTQRMGYEQTRGFQGYWGRMHGNELTAMETAEFLHDTYMGNYPGAETLWKLMHACRTGASRGRKYLPTSLLVGGKTGTYDGSTENPENGQNYNVAIRNHVLIFNVLGRQYGLVVLANTGSDESAALLAGGLLREYTGFVD